MSLPDECAVEFQPGAMRILYKEPRRSLLIALEFTQADTWQLRPETVRWWDGSAGLRMPVTPEERELVLVRVLEMARKQHHLRIHLAGEPAPAATSETGGPADGEDAAALASDDPELAELSRAASMPDAGRLKWSGNSTALLARIEKALSRVQPMADAGWEQAQSIARQLRWCRGALLGEDVEAPPGAFSMGLIATREFDMYGSEPDLASLINGIEREMNTRLREL